MIKIVYLEGVLMDNNEFVSSGKAWFLSDEEVNSSFSFECFEKVTLNPSFSRLFIAIFLVSREIIERLREGAITRISSPFLSFFGII